MTLPHEPSSQAHGAPSTPNAALTGRDDADDDAARRARGTSAEGKVEAEVSATGNVSALTGLRIDPQAMLLGPDQLAAAVLAAAERARREALGARGAAADPVLAKLLGIDE